MEINSNENQPIFDSSWHSKFKENGMVEVIELLTIEEKNRDEQKKLFLSGEIRNPQFEYPKLKRDFLEKREENLLNLKKDILGKENNEVVKQAYRWRINESLAKLRMLKSSISGEMRKFKRYADFIYGKPSKDIFNYTLQGIKKTIDSCSNSDRTDLKNLAGQLNFLIDFNMKETKAFELPSSEVIELAKKMTREEFSDLINIIPKDADKFDSIKIKEVFQEGLNFLEAENWQVIIDKNTRAINVVQDEQLVKIPESRVLKKDKMIKLNLHEIGTHIKRRVMGERSRLKLLSIGLDRYEKGEEGIATMREQTMSINLKDFSGFDGHLAIGLALGLDGKPRDFREVYEILEKYYLLKKIKSGKDSELAQKEAQEAAWRRCIRTFQGTDCQTLGVCYPKDIVYREGNIGVWEVIKRDSQEMKRFSMGKYDSANPRHLWILEQLGISDKNLEDIENEK